MTSNQLLGAVFIILLGPLLPSALAIDCGIFDDPASCNAIKNSDLSDEQKDFLIVNLFSNQSYKPDHRFVYAWNTGIEISTPPEDISIEDKGYIKNAWLSILAVMPSVIENDSLYVPANVTLLSAYNYDVEIPNDYFSDRKEHGRTCALRYGLIENTPDLQIYVNNNFVGNEKLSTLTLSEDSVIEAELEIKVKTKIEHYKWKKYCKRRVEGICKKHGYKCKFSHNDYKTDVLNLEDQIEVKYYDNSLNSSFELIRQNTGKLDFTDSVELSFENSSYGFYTHFYDFVYSLEPYYIITLRSREAEWKSVNNLYIDNRTITVKNLDNCELSNWNHFYSETKICNLDYEEINLTVKTDKLRYEINETIKAEIYPRNTFVRISYGNETTYAINSIEFKAEPFANKIRVEYKHFEAEKIIHVSDAKKWLILLNLSVFSGLNYFFYTIARKYYGGWI